jgi:hypothetical protein
MYYLYLKHAEEVYYLKYAEDYKIKSEN